MFSWYKYLIVSVVFSHLGFKSGSLFLIAQMSTTRKVLTQGQFCSIHDVRRTSDELTNDQFIKRVIHVH